MKNTQFSSPSILNNMWNSAFKLRLTTRSNRQQTIKTRIQRLIKMSHRRNVDASTWQNTWPTKTTHFMDTELIIKTCISLQWPLNIQNLFKARYIMCRIKSDPNRKIMLREATKRLQAIVLKRSLFMS